MVHRAGRPSNVRQPQTEAVARRDSQQARAQRKRPGVARLSARVHWVVPIAIAVLTMLMRVSAITMSQPLDFDDGVYGASALAMRSGAVPFRDFFSSQGPVFLPLVWLADVVGMRQLWAPRLLSVASSGAITLAIWALCRQVIGGVTLPALAAALAGFSGTLVLSTTAISSSGPALALSTSALAVAVAIGREPRRGLVVLLGLSAGSAICVKSLFVFPALLAIFVVLVVRSRMRELIGAVGVAAAVVFVMSVPWGLTGVWEQFVEFHLKMRPGGPEDGITRTVRRFWRQDLLLITTAAAALGVGAARELLWVVKRRGGRRSIDLGPLALLLWLAATIVLVALHHPLWSQHAVFLVPPLACVTALAMSRARATAAVVGMLIVILAPGHYFALKPIVAPDELQAMATVIDDLRSLPEQWEVVSDHPGLAWWADRRTPLSLIDFSHTRIFGGGVTAEAVLSASAEPEVCVIVAWTGRFRGVEFLQVPPPGYRLTHSYRKNRMMYIKEACTAHSA